MRSHPFIFLLTLGIFLSNAPAAQVGINSSGTPPHPAAGLDVDYTNKGLLPPRMTSAQRDLIPPPVPAGLLIYNTTTNCANMYNGSSWMEICGTCTPQPSVAAAGPDQLNLTGTVATLAGNSPANGTGAWSIQSGSGGSIGSPSLPASSFTGLAGSSYVLRWTITTSCGSTFDEVTISFASAVTFKRVFVTSTTTTGNMGGLAGADNICQTRANAASLGGTWKAWLSSSTQSVAARFTTYNLPYRLVTGTTIASSWADLTDGTLQNPINRTETGSSSVAPVIWTHTTVNGSSATTNTAQNCGNWTQSTSGNTLIHCAGSPNMTNQDWTAGYSGCAYSCDGNWALYCFEQ